MKKILCIGGAGYVGSKINEVLKSLIDLKNIKENNPSIKALAYQLYENNGVLKRDQVSEYLKNLGQNERKILRNLGVKFGRYHVFLYKLIKPEAVSLRTLLWKNYHQKYYDLKPPAFGLNFLDDKNFQNKNFMLLCGFEKFSTFFVRIDILERLFIKIMNSRNDEVYFKYNPIKKVKKIITKKTNKESPFIVLKDLNIN